MTARRRAPTPLLTAVGLTLARDLRLAFRKRGQLVQPLVFFAIVTTLFPLAISPELSRLRDVAPGVLWVAALLSSQLALEFLFRDDAHDGTLEQYALSGQSLTWLIFAKTTAHWLLTGVPLAAMAPLAGLSLGVPATMRFRRRRGAGFQRATMPLEPRAAYHLSGEARHEGHPEAFAPPPPAASCVHCSGRLGKRVRRWICTLHRHNRASRAASTYHS